MDHLFRHEYGKIVSTLSSKYSVQLIELIEDAVQDTLLKAMQLWSFNPVPENPSGWLYKVANNNLIDQLRKQKKLTDFELLPDIKVEFIEDNYTETELHDDQLKMVFACCHPMLSLPDQLMLSLKLLGGLNLKEIGHALFKREETVKKALTRAKTKFKNEIGEIDLPGKTELLQRLDSVVKVLYLMFNEGYKTTDSKQLVKKDICLEAIRLALLLVNNPNYNTPNLNALIALMYFNFARFDARTNEEGELVKFEKQDRTKWDRDLIKVGSLYLKEAYAKDEITAYHLEASIAGLYAISNSFETVDWPQILKLYDRLLTVKDNAIVRLNRIVVLRKVRGANTALKELDRLSSLKEMKNNYLYYSIQSDLCSAIGQRENAVSAIQTAIGFCENLIEKKYLENSAAKLVSD